MSGRRAPHNMPSLVKPSTFGLQRQCPVTNDCTDSASRRVHLSSDRRSSRSHDAGTCSPLSTVDVTTLFWILRSPTTVIWPRPSSIISASQCVLFLSVIICLGRYAIPSFFYFAD
jgi:hypothetical protein